jgi:hypothetical protein
VLLPSLLLMVTGWLNLAASMSLLLLLLFLLA